MYTTLPGPLKWRENMSPGMRHPKRSPSLQEGSEKRWGLVLGDERSYGHTARGRWHHPIWRAGETGETRDAWMMSSIAGLRSAPPGEFPRGFFDSTRHPRRATRNPRRIFAVLLFPNNPDGVCPLRLSVTTREMLPPTPRCQQRLKLPWSISETGRNTSHAKARTALLHLTADGRWNQITLLSVDLEGWQ